MQLSRRVDIITSPADEWLELMPDAIPKTVDLVLTELGAVFREEIAATQVAIACLRTVAYQVSVEKASLGSANDDALLLGAGVPDIGFLAVVEGEHGVQTMVEQFAEGGPFAQRLTQQLLVTLYTAWEADLRGRLAAAHGCSINDIQASFFGDLRHLRHDIVHHRGNASAEHATRCEGALLNRQLAVGDPIFLTDAELRSMGWNMPWAELLKPTSPRADRLYLSPSQIR